MLTEKRQVEESLVNCYWFSDHEAGEVVAASHTELHVSRGVDSLTGEVVALTGY
jgi:hypothetical protein